MTILAYTDKLCPLLELKVGKMTHQVISLSIFQPFLPVVGEALLPAISNIIRDGLQKEYGC